MRQIPIYIWIIAVALFNSCTNPNAGFDVINSQSFPEANVGLGKSLNSKILQPSGTSDSINSAVSEKLSLLNSQIELFKKTPDDKQWSAVLQAWGEIGRSELSNRAAGISPEFAGKWADVNIQLLKITEDVRFGDELEKLLDQTQVPVLTENQIKSIVYTHVDDQIFVNLLGSSSVVHHHTTGGTVTLIQQTSFPESNEIILKAECGDVRFLSVCVRIPSWAKNPTVQHGNVKYVARPGEYCEISRKWNNGDQIDIRLKN